MVSIVLRDNFLIFIVIYLLQIIVNIKQNKNIFKAFTI